MDKNKYSHFSIITPFSSETMWSCLPEVSGLQRLNLPAFSAILKRFLCIHHMLYYSIFPRNCNRNAHSTPTLTSNEILYVPFCYQKVYIKENHGKSRGFSGCGRYTGTPPCCGARLNLRPTKWAQIYADRCTALVGLIIRLADAKHAAITIKRHHPIGWCLFMVAEAGLEPTASGL